MTVDQKIGIGVFLSIICCVSWWIAFTKAKKEDDDGLSVIFLIGGIVLSVWWGMFLLSEMVPKQGISHTDYDHMLLGFAWIPCGISIVLITYLLAKLCAILFSVISKSVEIQKNKIIKKRIAKRKIKLIKLRTKEIKKQSKHIQNEIKKYSELSNFSTCTVKCISDINNIMNLFTIINSSSEKDFEDLLEPSLNCAKQKKEIEDKVKYVAGLYKGIGNEKAANDLLRRI